METKLTIHFMTDEEVIKYIISTHEQRTDSQ